MYTNLFWLASSVMTRFFCQSLTELANQKNIYVRVVISEKSGKIYCLALSCEAGLTCVAF
jgi:hypothetical protein